MSALRERVKRPRFWITLIAAAALAAAAIFDWTRPPQQQASVRLYAQIVVRPYQRFIRPGSSRFIRCRYQPTCSYYSLIAVQTHGLPKGLWLTTKRLFRCTPWVPMGTIDPVPPANRSGAAAVPRKWTLARRAAAEQVHP